MIDYKTPAEIEKMRCCNQIVAEVLNEIKERAHPGVTTLELDQLSEKIALRHGAKPAFKGYHGFPNSLCASVNNVIVHGIPSHTELCTGDILSVDFGVYSDGFYGDAAITIRIGEVTPEASRLVEVTRASLEKAIDQVQVGNRVSDLSVVIQDFVEAQGYSVVRDFVGHGIGRELHEDPQVPNFGVSGTGARLKPGMVLAIEPMVNEGGHEVEIKQDGWTAVTKDGKLSAHFEHSVAVTENGPVVLSKLL